MEEGGRKGGGWRREGGSKGGGVRGRREKGDEVYKATEDPGLPTSALHIFFPCHIIV